MGPLVAEEIRADHVKVKWNRPEDNGGSDITGYVLEKMDLDTGRWVPAGEVKYSLIFTCVCLNLCCSFCSFPFLFICILGQSL